MVKRHARSHPYRGMKNLSIFAAAFLRSTTVRWTAAVLWALAVFAPLPLAAQNSSPVTGNRKVLSLIDWNFLMSSSWEESKTLHNRAEFNLNFFLPSNEQPSNKRQPSPNSKPAFTLRAQVLDRRPLNFELDSPWGDPEKAVTNITTGLYHKNTGSRLLFGTLDEWGLSARIRNPWTRSPPYTENHKPLIADLKTAASSTKNDEVYLYLSSPVLNILSNVKLRSFISAQTEVKNFTPALAGGLDFSLPNKTGLLTEFFYTQALLPPTKSSSWFSNPPSLPEREFKFFAAGGIFHNKLISVSSDWAVSETFAWGTDIYGNFGISITPALSFGAKERPLSVSIAADGAGERFIYRDGLNHGDGFRTAAKIEWKGERNALLRFNTVLRGSGIGEAFNRSSTGFYYRFPATRKRDEVKLIRFTRISINADRNAENTKKINDSISGYIGFSVNLQKMGIGAAGVVSPIGVNISGSIKGLTSSETVPLPYPFTKEIFSPDKAWNLNTTGISCEFTWSPLKFQFKSKVGYTNNIKTDEIWDISLSTAYRFKHGRLSFKAASPVFPEKWNCTISWRAEIK